MESNFLKDQFTELCYKYSSNIALVDEYWEEIEKAYSSKKRFYHNLDHIKNLIELAQAFNNDIKDIDCLLFSIFYHDIVYKATSKENEEKSAVLAKQRMEVLGVSKEKIEKCYQQILATKTHDSNEDSDTSFLLDFDLAILSSTWKEYEAYTRQIRNEYIIYPGIIYKKGRKKVLKKFLEQKSIYKTPVFLEKYEDHAHTNIRRELNGFWR